jgi:hypothetical protein
MEKQLSALGYWLGLISTVLALIFRAFTAINMIPPHMAAPGGSALNSKPALRGRRYLSSSTLLHITKSLVGIAVLCLLSCSARADCIRYNIVAATVTCPDPTFPYCVSIGITGTYELSNGMIVGPWSFFGHPLDGAIAIGDGSDLSCGPFCANAFAGNGRGFFSRGIDPSSGYADGWIEFNLDAGPISGEMFSRACLFVYACGAQVSDGTEQFIGVAIPIPTRLCCS